MPLIPLTLHDELRKFMDEDSPTFEGFPADEGAAAELWAGAIDAYAGLNILPTPTPIATASARAALSVGLLGMSAPGAGPLLFEAAFSAYAAAIALGMGPSFVATPPPPGLAVAMAAVGAAQLALVVPISTADQLLLHVGVIDFWFRTGTSTPSGGGSVSPWS